MIIYILTKGQYSECSIIGAYSTCAKAEEAKRIYAADAIEEFELDFIPEYPPGKRRFEVSMERNGECSCYDVGIDYTDCDWRPILSYVSPATDRFAFYVWAEDEQEAIKIANEKRIACIADGRWSGDYRQDKERWEQTEGKKL